ncbi:MAG: trypsin, partial [Myxococcales bacterium]|nr:trypsin [Myxococcales bacterium]
LQIKGDRPHIVMFLTDGQPTIGETREGEIVKEALAHNKAKASIFMFGIGDDINTHLLDRIAEQNRGSSMYLKPNQEIEHKIASFYNQISYPVMSGLSLDFGNVKTYSVVPRRIPDLFKGSQIIVVGRYRNDGHVAVTLKGSVQGTTRSFAYDAKFPAQQGENEFIAKLWAHRQIGVLLDEIRLKGESHELKQEVIQLAKRFGIVTPYTSYLVVEPSSPTVTNWRRRPRPRFILRRSDTGVTTLSPSPTQGPRDEEDKAPMKLALKSGKSSIKTAEKLKRLKDSDRVQEGQNRTRNRFASGRSFELKSGGWVDARFRSSMKSVKIKYMSSAYFSLLKLHPELKAALQLGERVTIVIGATAVVVGTDGESALTPEQLKQKL